MKINDPAGIAANSPGSNPPGKALSRLVMLQVVIAVCALAVTIVLSLTIPKLIQTKSQLEADVRTLEDKKKHLEETNRETERNLTQFYLQVQNQNSRLAQAAINPDAAQVIPRVDIYTADKDQEPKARQIQNGLQKKGFTFENVQYEGDEPFHPEQTEVRFFRYPQDKGEAQVILGIIQSSFGVTNSRVSYVEPDKSGKTGPRQFEIWFKKDPL